MRDIGGNTIAHIQENYATYIRSTIVMIIFEETWDEQLDCPDEKQLELNMAAIEALTYGDYDDQALTVYNLTLDDDECFDNVGQVRAAFERRCDELRSFINFQQKRRGFRGWKMLNQQ